MQYGDKMTIAKHGESDEMTESKSMTANHNYGNDTNFSNIMVAAGVAAGSSVKMEHLIKSEKSKSFSESGNNKSECIENDVQNERTDNNGSSLNQMNLIGSHQSSNCYANTIEQPVEQSMNSDEFSYRNYSNADLSRPTVPFANDMMANRALVANYEYSAVRSYENAMNGIPSGPTFDRYDMNLGNLYASSLSMQRSNLTYPSYLNTFGADDPNQQKYLHEHHFAQSAMLKNEPSGENATPYYPKPMYHYDAAFPLAGFSAMNLSLRTAAVAAAATTSLPIMDLSTPTVTSSNFSHGHNSPHYSSVQRLQAASSAPKASRTPNLSPHANTNEQQQHSDSNRMPLNNLKLQSYQLHGENFATQNSRSPPPNEPVDLCNSPIKPTHSGAFTADNSMETAQNRPYSRDSTSDSNASPYVDAYKGEPMGKLAFCSLQQSATTISARAKTKKTKIKS